MTPLRDALASDLKFVLCVIVPFIASLILCWYFGGREVSLTGVYFTTHSRLVFTTHSRPVFTTHDRPVFTRRLPDGESVALFLQQILLSGGERSWSIYT
jgi:hypothetical protein